MPWKGMKRNIMDAQVKTFHVFFKKITAKKAPISDRKYCIVMSYKFW